MANNQPLNQKKERAQLLFSALSEFFDNAK